MKIISDKSLFCHYIAKHNIENIFDKGILEHASLHFYQKDDFILEAGSELSYYYLLVDGKIKIHYLFENGKSMFLKFYQDFNTLGDLELLKNIPVICNAEAIEPSYVIAIPSNILRQQCKDDIRFLRHLVDSLSEKLYGTINNSSYNFVYPLINRLSSYLVEHLGDKGYIIVDSSFEEIAQFLGTTYRHLNRTFNELEEKSIIKCEGKTIYVLDESRLRELSKNPYIKPL